jgi:nucleoside-diphosphate-sugar epimerase
MTLTVAISGANGWLGTSAINVLVNKFPDWKIYALTRVAAGNIRYPNVVEITYKDFAESNIQVQGLIHTAFKTRNFIGDLGVESYLAENNEILQWLKNFLSQQKLLWAATVSSGAVAIYIEKIEKDSQLNELDLYGKLKWEEEEILLSSSTSQVAVGRLWGASGRFMKNYKIYALGQFIEAGINNEDIYISSSEKVYRRYVDAEIFMEVLIRSALQNDRIIFDSGGVLVSLENLAEEIANYFNENSSRKIKVKYSETQTAAAHPNYFPNDLKFNELTNYFSIRSLSILEQIKNTELAIRAQIYSDLKKYD